MLPRFKDTLFKGLNEFHVRMYQYYEASSYADISSFNVHFTPWFNAHRLLQSFNGHGTRHSIILQCVILNKFIPIKQF
jgi:hypothetical protein